MTQQEHTPENIIQPAGIRLWKSRGESTLKDTLSGRGHSHDFMQARASFLRNRVVIIGIIFLVLSPFWALIDQWLLPPPTSKLALAGRLALVGGLIATVGIAWRFAHYITIARACAGALILLPALFYGLVLSTLPSTWSGNLIGYSFIPYMLVVMLGIFPFTLIESLVMGLLLIGIEAYALHLGGAWQTLAAIQQIWLLSALLFITLTTNYFQLGLLLRLYRAATHDPLTGLLNRGALIENVNQARAAGQPETMSLLMMDLDHFKRVNDQYGHAAGDQVLIRFAQVLRASVRPQDIVARYGGEEFTTILINTSKSEAMKVAENIRQKVASTPVKTHDGQTLQVTVSIGVASLYPDEPLDTAAQRADQRLYEAKKLARNCVVGV